MRQAKVYVHGQFAAILTEYKLNQQYKVAYIPNYVGAAISLTMPVTSSPYLFEQFPSFFDGVLPEGIHLAGMLRLLKIDEYDYFAQLMAVGGDLVGAVTVEPIF